MAFRDSLRVQYKYGIILSFNECTHISGNYIIEESRESESLCRRFLASGQQHP